MSQQTKLVAVDVAARVVQRATSVPALADAPFAATATLEPGIHVHWALPDALTAARADPTDGPTLRGVPDLWLVVRFNPVAGAQPRTYRAWVVDSFSEQVRPLAQWTPPIDRPADRIHTAAGVLAKARAGWGRWDPDEPFDALSTAYYPACRRRLGFHDDLSDLGGPGQSGLVSYAVLGWYSAIGSDPFYNDRVRRGDKLGHRTGARSFTQLSTSVAKAVKGAGEATGVVAQWKVDVAIKQSTAPSAGEVIALSASEALQAQVSSAAATSLAGLVEAIPLAKDGPQAAVIDALMPDDTRALTVCHGSVMDVPLRDTAQAATPLGDDAVFLYPNLQRALAEVASRDEDPDAADHLDMMLGQLGQQSGSTAGVVDLPGAQHARTFQSVPGRSSWFARLDIHAKPPISATAVLGLVDLQAAPANPSWGNWQAMGARSAMSAAHQQALVKPIPAAVLSQPPAQSAPPSEAEIVGWIAQLRAAFATASAQAAVAGKPLHPRLVRVQDHRENAKPTALGRPGDGLGPSQAGWWVDLGDPEDEIDLGDPANPADGNPLHRILAELYVAVRGSNVHLPDAEHLFEVPGPRWYRPWAPHLVLYGAGRSYRHGMDGRFRADGHLLTRVGGEVLSGLVMGSHTVLGKDLVAAAAGVAAPGVPAVAAGLLAEHALADGQNSEIMARAARRTGDPRAARLAPKQAMAATRALWLGRGSLLAAPQKDVIAGIEPIGTAPGAVGLQAWRPWYGALFLDSTYTHRRKRFNDAFELPPEFVEAVDRTPVVAPDREQSISERQVATVSVIKVLKQSLVTKLTLDPQGNVVHQQPPPDGVEADTFDEMDVVSAAMAGLDDALLDAGEREQGGFVHVNRVRVYDTFGRPVDWSSNVATLDPLPGWATALPARLATWGRLGFRLQDAADPTVEASPLRPPVCGILLPDFVDQALEVYDATGLPIGQLTADDPVEQGGAQAFTLAVTFTLLPWVAAGLAPGADPTGAITNETLRRLVQALIAQPIDVPAGAPGGWYETGLTAMLRVLDTVRSTLDPSPKPTGSRVRLLGEPVLVMNLRLSFQASTADVQELRGDPPLLSEPPALPVLRVRVGDVTRPDDGVLGCFLTGASPAEDRFAPVSLEAAQKAVLNQLVTSAGVQQVQPATHPFVAGQVAEFDVAAGAPVDTVVLADPRGSLYATCGMLPRKTIVLPKDFVEPALDRLEPTFRVGPILGYERGGSLTPVLPAPVIEGMRATFVHDDDATYPELPVPPVLGVGELPPVRVRLTEGWARMSQEE